MHDLARLNELASAEIDALERDGIRVTADQVVEINALGWAIQTPETRRLLSRGRPVSLAGVSLWPLTLRALDWLERNRIRMDVVSPSIGYAMAYGRSDGPELDTEGREASKAVNVWYRSLRCTAKEFQEAVQQVDNQDAKPETPPDIDGKPMSLGDFSAFLSATCGADADFWERRCSLGHCLATLSMYVIQNHHDKRPCSQDPRIIAERAMGYAIDKIRAAHVLAEVPHG
jgi:hypothetical protein